MCKGRENERERKERQRKDSVNKKSVRVRNKEKRVCVYV